jgi:anti-sigma regulatory factor (Ser/Thr protein kinase)
MPISKKQFQVSAFLASFFFISVIGIGMFKFDIARATGTLPVLSVINISADLCSMAFGYVLFIISVIDRSHNEKNLNNYLLLLFTCFSSAFLDEVCWIVDGDLSQIYLNVVANTLYFMGAPVMAFLFWRYVVSYLGVDNPGIKRFNVILSCGLLIAVIVRLLNILFGYYFFIKPDGHYQRGDYYIFSNLYAYATMVLTLVLVYLARKRFKKYQIVILYMYAFFPLAIGILSVFTFGLSLSSPVIMLVLLLMYCILTVIQSRERSVSDNELQMANAIQEGMLPHIFPPYPERTEFDLYASMNPAKVVGGDFYDFYMPDADHLVVTIADVSGKGIPAALMMMVTKTLLKNRGLSDFDDCSKILTSVNNQLCENNELDMFITVWVAVLTLSTGELRYANAGHEYPAIKRKDGKFELIKERHSPPIGCMENINYKEKSIMLNPGDIIYVYTDGVTEANNRNHELFGEKRMLEALDLPCNGDMILLNKNIRDSINAFIDGSQQFDDITMLNLKYNGPCNSGKAENEMKQLKVKADVSELDQVLSFADTVLEEMDCPAKVQMQIDIAVEEIFVNIAHYAYPDGEGEAVISIDSDKEAKSVSILFEDQGTPYDPLQNEDPDITLSADDRPIGGLGIFMVKKSMDDVSYEYKDGKNRLTIKKNF